MLTIPTSKISKDKDRNLISATRYTLEFSVKDVDPWADNVEQQLINTLTAEVKSWVAIQQSQLIKT